MNDGDLAANGLEHGDLVEIETALPSGGKRLLKLTAISYDIALGSVAAYYPRQPPDPDRLSTRKAARRLINRFRFVSAKRRSAALKPAAADPGGRDVCLLTRYR